MQITLPNGQVANKVESKRKDATLIKSNTQLQYEDVNVRRKLSDLPDVTSINIISQVLCYYLFGLSSEDIATITKLSINNVHNILMSNEFDEYKKKVLDSINETDSQNIRDFINSKAMNAAQRVIDVMNSDNPKYALPAAQDILDRAGHRPIDVIEHRNKIDNELRIVYITKDTNHKQLLNNITTIDTDCEVVDE